MHFGPKSRVYGIDVCTHVHQKARAYNSPAWDRVLYKPFHLQVQIVAKPPKIFQFSVITLKQAPTPPPPTSMRYHQIDSSDQGGGSGGSL